MFLMLGLLVTPSELLPVALPATLIALFLVFVARPLAVLISLAPFVFSWLSARRVLPDGCSRWLCRNSAAMRVSAGIFSGKATPGWSRPWTMTGFSR